VVVTIPSPARCRPSMRRGWGVTALDRVAEKRRSPPRGSVSCGPNLTSALKPELIGSDQTSQSKVSLSVGSCCLTPPRLARGIDLLSDAEGLHVIQER